jgi:hypothetical protein
VKNSKFNQVLLLVVALLVASCSGSEDSWVKESPPDIQGNVWLASMNATNDSIEVGEKDSNSSTRALFYGGNERRYYTLWDKGDVAHVYKGDDEVGTMSPPSAYWGTLKARLEGSLTGEFAVNDVLGIYLPSRAMDFSGQSGSIYNLSSNYSYQQTTSTVTEASTGILSLSDVNPSHRQAYYRYVFADADNGSRIHPEVLEIYASGGKLVKTKAVDGTTTYFSDADPMTITAIEEDGEYPAELFVALLSDNDDNDTFRFKVTTGSDIYVGPVSTAVSYKVKSDIGSLWRIYRTLRKTTPATSLTVADIPSRVFTGSAYEPVVTVTDASTDPATTLTLDTDYSVSYANNVNVGTATVTVKGLADAGAVAATKYLGTKDKTFQITQATPVIVMDDATITLVNNTNPEQNTATRIVTRVFIDNNANGTWDEGTDYDITALCTVTYSSSNDAVATVNASTGQVTAAGPTTCTITATVAEADNWTSKSATYTVNVEQEVNGGNSVNPWTSGGEPEGGKIYVE